MFHRFPAVVRAILPVLTVPLLVCHGTAVLPAAEPVGNSARIQPYSKNPHYWQYEGRPILLLGGSKTDHLFLLNDLESHLDEMQAVGANYVRNTMSQREEKELKPHLLLPDGKFDLEKWNPEYWRRFENMLKWTAERDIIVQVEVWDRFDYSTKYWETSPWNPGNNVNYTYQQTGFAPHYPQHPSRDRQPFFHTIKGMPRYQAKLERIRRYQEAFVDKMLSYSLSYGHVLYCMNNETSTPAPWGQYWIERIETQAAKQQVTVFATDMFDDAFKGEAAEHTRLVFEDPAHYRFADISQVNSRNYGQKHWEQLQWLLRKVDRHPRPSNHTKIYGSGYYSFGTGGPEDGVERFWRNLIGGSAAVRFHRPDAGNGLSDYAKGSIKAARLLENRIRLWEVSPKMELLSDRTDNEAYVAAKPGEFYAVYFTNGGSVRLDLSRTSGPFEITWISISLGVAVQTSQTSGYRRIPTVIRGGKVVTLTAPYRGGWVAAITRQAKK